MNKRVPAFFVSKRPSDSEKARGIRLGWVPFGALSDLFAWLLMQKVFLDRCAAGPA